MPTTVAEVTARNPRTSIDTHGHIFNVSALIQDCALVLFTLHLTRTENLKTPARLSSTVTDFTSGYTPHVDFLISLPLLQTVCALILFMLHLTPTGNPKTTARLTSNVTDHSRQYDTALRPYNITAFTPDYLCSQIIHVASDLD